LEITGLVDQEIFYPFFGYDFPNTGDKIIFNYQREEGFFLHE
jgi:hypothetical protein